MVEIIKKGLVKSPGDKFRVNCKHCGSLLEFMRMEAKLVFDQRDGDYYRLICPACTRDVTIASEVLEHHRHKEGS